MMQESKSQLDKNEKRDGKTESLMEGVKLRVLLLVSANLNCH